MSSRSHARFLALAVAGAGLVGAAGPALAQPFPLNGFWTYQGRLTDAGAPANGLYDVQIAVFDRPVGGAAIAVSFHNNVTVTNGLFTIPDVNTGFLGVFQGDRRWAELQIRPGASVGAFTILAPRQELTATPYAMWANRAAVAGTVNNHTLNAAYNSGGAGAGRVIQADSGEVAVQGTSGMRVESTLRLGDVDTTGVLELYTATATRTFELRDHFGEGGAVEGYEEGGVVRTYYIEPDINGTGGYLEILRDGGASALVVNGNAIGGDPTVTISGDSRSMTFSPGAGSGNSSVVLPAEAVSSVEMFDEPGISTFQGFGTASYATGVVTTVMSQTITVPAAGYVMVIATVESQLSHTNGTTSNITIGTSDSATTWPSSQDYQYVLPSVLPTGSYEIPITVHGTYEVTAAGTFTYYCNARESAGSFTVNDVAFTLLYVPTLYGIFDDPSSGGDGPDGEDQPRDPTDPDAQRAQAEHNNSLRIERELAQVKAELAEIRRLVGTNTSQVAGKGK